MKAPFAARADQDALIVSFLAPARALSWAVLNGGYCHADHVINHHVSGDDRWFRVEPEQWLEESASRLGLRGTVVAMATAVEIKNLVEVSLFGGGKRVTCFATVGCGNALSVGDPASVAIEQTAPSPLHTINLILTIQPGLRDEALVEAIQIATEGRVRALYGHPEFAVPSRRHGHGHRLHCRRFSRCRTGTLLRQAYRVRRTDRQGGIHCR